MIRTTPIRVLAADHQPLFLDSVVRAIRQDARFQVVGSAGDGRAALEALQAHEPEVALLDVALPGLDGERVLRACVRDRLATNLVMLSGEFSCEAAYRLLQRGAAACLTKDVGFAELREAVTTVAAGGTVVYGETLTRLRRAIRLREHREGPVLSDREAEILHRAAEGQSVPTMAREMHVSPATVKTHLQHLYDKLGARDRAAAVVVAMRLGLLE